MCCSDGDMLYLEEYYKAYCPMFFYPHELQNNREIDNIQTKSCDNLADLFTKSIPYPTFSKCVE
jgi:hypothetical protein